jgi:stage V sporulation protein B
MLVARVFLLVSGFGVSIILARELGPAEFGIYGVVMSFLVWFERIVGGGVPRGTTTLLSRAPEQRAVIEQSTRVLLAVLTLPVFAVAWIYAPDLAAYLEMPGAAGVMRVAALNLPVMALFFAYDSVFSGLRMFGAQSLLQILQSAAKLAGVVVLVFVGVTVTSAFAAHVVATVLAVAWAALRFPARGARTSVKVMVDLVRLALPLGGYLLALLVLMNLSLWQLQATARHPPEEVGFYVASLNLTRIMMMVPSAVSVVLYASLIWALSESRHDLATRYLQGALRFALILIVPACILLAVDSKPVMELLFGATYAAGGPILTLLCIAFGMVAILDVLLNATMASGGLRSSAWTLVALIPALFVANAILIPRAGGVGAAGASAAVLTLGTIVSLVMTHLRLGATARLATVLRVAAAAAAIGLAAYLIPVSGPWLVVKLGGLGLLYLVLLWMLGEITTADAKPFALWKPEGA